MRDKHGLDEEVAVKDDCKKKIERWVESTRRGGKNKGGKAGKRARQGLSAEQQSGAAMPEISSEGHRHVCDVCGAEAMLPVCLADQGLTFSCAHIGRRCGSFPAVAGGLSAAQPPQMSLFTTPGLPPNPQLQGRSVFAEPLPSAPRVALFGAAAATPAQVTAMLPTDMAADVAIPGLDSDDEDL